jgi:hypothetical protein
MSLSSPKTCIVVKPLNEVHWLNLADDTYILVGPKT